MKIDTLVGKYLDEGIIRKTEKLPLTDNEKNLIGDIGIYKEVYKLDSTQSNYRFSRTVMSQAFTGTEDLSKLKKLIKKVK